MSPADVHKAIRIRERYLTALEEERWEMLPGDAYTKGFLRTYAEYLGLDGQLYIEEYNERVAAREAEPLVPDAIAKSPNRRSGILFRTIASVIVLGAVVGGLAAWRHAGTPARPHVDAAQAAAPVARRRAAVKTVAVKHAKVVTAAPTYAVIRAARDRSWLSVRLGGPAGREIFRGTLAQGQKLRYGLVGRKIWVRMGRPLALDIRIGTRLVAGLPASPTNLLLMRTGATP